MRTVYHLLVRFKRPIPGSLVVALLLSSTVAGIVEEHAESLHSGGILELCHPDLAVHVEPARDPEPPCLACLLRLIGQGELLPSPLSRFEILALGRVPHHAVTVASASPVRLPVSRGPPAV